MYTNKYTLSLGEMRVESEIQIILKKENNKDTFIFSGVLDERADLSLLLSQTSEALYFNLKNIQRINSFGIRVWTDMLAQLNHTKIILEECPIAFIEQINMITEFQGNAIIDSFYMPFYCASCKAPHHILTQLSKALTPSFIKEIDSQFPCPTCHKPMEFDDHIQSFFLFLQRQVK